MTRAVVFIGCWLGLAAHAEARQTADQVARAIVIGQAYVSGNVYLAGFDDNEKRSWPRQITFVPLHEAASERRSADFFRTVTQDSEEQYYFPQREPAGDGSARDIFATVDRMALEDRNLARYRADGRAEPVALFGWDARLPVTDISFRDTGQLRPATARERDEIAADKKSAVPKDFDCTTVPQFLDSAKVMLTAKISGSNVTIRLSHYMTPGCAGHLSEIYVLDVLEPGQQLRRFEFRHYQGVI